MYVSIPRDDKPFIYHTLADMDNKDMTNVKLEHLKKIISRTGPKSFIKHIGFKEIIDGQITITSDPEGYKKLVPDGHILYHTTTTTLASLKTPHMKKHVNIGYIDPTVINKLVLSSDEEKFDKCDIINV